MPHVLSNCFIMNGLYLKDDQDAEYEEGYFNGTTGLPVGIHTRMQITAQGDP